MAFVDGGIDSGQSHVRSGRLKEIKTQMARKRQDEIKFGFFTDSHFSVIRQSFRTDSFFESVLSKMDQTYSFFEEEKCRFAVFGGDFFDRPASMSREMIKKIRDVIMAHDLKTYFIWGQHDLSGYNRDTAKNSNLLFLRNICDGRLEEIGDHIDLPGIHLYACHVDQSPAERLLEIPDNLRNPVVVIVHALLFDKDGRFGEIDVHSLPETKAALVLSGDLHSGFPLTKSHGTTFYNPGSLARTSREIRRPKACSISITPLLDDWSIQVKDFYPQCEENPFPPLEEKIEVSKDQDSTTYLDAFNKFKSESKDIFERLEKVGIEHKVDKGILDYILSKKK